MIAFFLVFAAIAVGGAATFRAAWIGESRAARIAEEAGPFEQVTASAICGVAVWTAINWVLAFTHLLRAPIIVAMAVAVIAVGGYALYRTRAAARDVAFPLGFGDAKVERAGIVLVLVIPVFLWVAYAGMRALVLPVLSPDGNAYHMPKALLLMWNGGYRAFDYPDFRVTSYPFDYELLLTNVMAVDGTDRATAWITIAFFLLFLLATAAHAERMQEARGETRAVRGLASALVVGAAPIVLLQSGVHKNDLMAATFATLAFLFVGRWIARGERLYGVLTIIAVALALGTKPSGAFVAVGCAPFFLAGLIRVLRTHPERRARELAVHGVAVIAAFVLLGGVVVLFNLIRSHHPFGVAEQYQSATGYGAWSNLFSFTYLLLTRPFSSTIRDVWVPWRGERWWWMTYELHTSHYGWLFTVVALLLVPLVIRDWRRGAKEPARTSRLTTVGVAVITAAIMVPMRIAPSQEGGFNAFPRYLMFVLPPVVAYVIPRLAARLAALAPSRPFFAPAFIVFLAAHFTLVACLVARWDMYQPLPYVLRAFAADEPVYMPEQARDRVAFLLDELAGPRDKVLFDAGFDSWTYPAYGRDWKRPVTLVSPGLEPIPIPDDVLWVASDHSFETGWGHPDFKSMAQFDKYINQGTPSAQSLRAIRQLLKDPRFRLIYRSLPTNQALFKRRAPGETPDRDTPPIILKWKD